MFGQRVASDGTLRGTQFQVNSYTDANQYNPSVCCGAFGDFVVAWNSHEQVAVGSDIDIFAQRFTNSGAPSGGEFQVNSYTSGPQGYPAVACAKNAFVIVWESSDPDGDEQGVFGQRFAPIFAPVPVLSWAGLGAIIAGLFAAGSATLRRRRR